MSGLLPSAADETERASRSDALRATCRTAGSGAGASALRPCLIDGARGALSAFYFEPKAGVPALGDILVVPAFAEEMNRCRAMVSLQARALASQGVGTLVLDPFGTGDSEGEFAQASWTQWRDDLSRGIEWLDVHGNGCRALLGLRLGAVMAAELARDHQCVRNMLLWQPVLSGKTHFTQFLRIRIASELNLPNRVKSTAELRQLAAAGQIVEVSGYDIGPDLAAELDAVAFSADSWASRVQTDWFEINASEQLALSPLSARGIENVQTLSGVAHSHVVTGPAFWHVHERELAPELIEATSAQVRHWTPVLPTDSREVSPAPPIANAYPLTLPCGNEQLSAFMHGGAPSATRGVVIVVAGGPQYRAGAHRQFVTMARRLSCVGYPTLRFDLRGMGDSSGRYVGFEDSGLDIRSAIDELMLREPQLREVVLIGECESASGILFYAWQDARVGGAVLVNPWVRTPEGQAQVILKDYYLDRLRSRDFWSKVRSGRFNPVKALGSLAHVVRDYVRGKRSFARASRGSATDDLAGLPLPTRTAAGLSRFEGQVLLLMSGNDYIAREFDEVTAASRAWQGLLDAPNVHREDVEGADHTFSKRVWKTAATDAIADWMLRW